MADAVEHDLAGRRRTEREHRQRRRLDDEVVHDGIAGPRVPAAGAVAIDRSALDELTGGDEQLNRDIVTRYLQALSDDLDELWQALRDGDVRGMRRQAHRIAGASRTVGAHDVAAQATLLEQAAAAQTSSYVTSWP